MRKILLLLTLFCAFLLSSCKSKETIVEVPVKETRTEYIVNTKIDSIYIHDSINMYIRGDTVFKDKVKLIYKDRLRVDTISTIDSIDKPIYITKTEIKEVEKKLNIIQKILIASGIFAWVIFIVWIIKKKYI